MEVAELTSVVSGVVAHVDELELELQEASRIE
jgi:hypothetical protein